MRANKAPERHENNERVVADFSLIGPEFPGVLGRINYSRAHKPLMDHVHEGRMEFVYVVKGRQRYTVDGTVYDVNSGELFFTRADEPHSTFGHPEDKSLFYYLIIDTKALSGGILGLDGADGGQILDALDAMKKRVFRARADTKKLLDGMMACTAESMPFRATVLRNLLSSFIISVIESEQKSGSRAPAALKDVIGYIEKNIYENITLDTLASIAGLSVPRFKSSFRKLVGIPPHEYVLRKKVETAKGLLALPGCTITDISYRLLFSSSQYFSTVFKRYTAVTPSQFRASLPAQKQAQGN